MNFVAIFLIIPHEKNITLKPQSYYKAFSVSRRTAWREYVTKERELELG